MQIRNGLNDTETLISMIVPQLHIIGLLPLQVSISRS